MLKDLYFHKKEFISPSLHKRNLVAMVCWKVVHGSRNELLKSCVSSTD